MVCTGRQNKGFVLLASIFLVLFLGVMLGAAIFRADMEFDNSEMSVAKKEAFYAAEAGLETAIFEIRKDPDWRPDPSIEVPLDRIPGDDSTAVGYFSVEVGPGGEFNNFDTVWIRAVGHDSQRKIRKVVISRVMVENPAAFLLSTMGDINIVSGANLDETVLARDINFLVNDGLDDSDPNKYIHANGTIYFLREVNGDDSPFVLPNPVDSINIPSMTFAGVDTEHFHQLSQTSSGTYYAGDISIDLSSVPPEVNIIYADGNINVSGSYDHSLIVIANGDLYLEDSIKSNSLSGPEPQLGLLAKNDVIIPESSPSSMTIEAFVMADGGGDSNGQFIAVGDKEDPKDSLTLKGAIAVRGEGEESAVDLTLFQNREYIFNTELKDNRSIPFLPFIANQIKGTWFEAFEPNDGLPAPVPPSP